MSVIRVCQRSKCPATWHIGRRCVWAGQVLELIEIDADRYTWIDIRPVVPGDTTASVNETTLEECA